MHLIFRVNARPCAIRVADLVETMRPLEVRPLPGAPDFVLGSAVVRGRPAPVVDLAVLLDGSRQCDAARWLSVRTASDRPVLLAVDDVHGLRRAHDVDGAALAPLLTDAAAHGVEALARLDGELLTVLDMARVVSDAVWSALRDTEGQT